ncbi:MAG: hypothetical protein GKR94_06995 [Gammaproteobacteria bacterium]|nr:hypothetical protein [Gammaproteobacteria bacterium]
MLSTQQIRSFERNGFLGPFTLAPHSTELLEPGRLAGIGRRLRELDASITRNAHVHSQMLFRLISCRSIMDRLRSLLGNDILSWTSHIVVRQPGSRGQGWHSDSINQFIRGIHVTVALTDMTEDNGCLQIIPGSHLYRSSLSSAVEVGDLNYDDPDSAVYWADVTAPWGRPHQRQSITVTSGQFFFTWGGLWHFVGPNKSAQSRVAVVARYARPDVACRDYGFSDAKIVPGDLLPCVMVSGVDRHGLNDLRTAPAGEVLFERAAV